jgi:nucleotide-binding universal stress UspA family protein
VLERVSGKEGNFAFDCGEALVRTDGLPLDHEIGSGEVAPTLVSITQERGCDGIVLCARGLGAVRGALLGSVSRAILQAATLPVTVVRRIDAKGPI